MTAKKQFLHNLQTKDLLTMAEDAEEFVFYGPDAVVGSTERQFLKLSSFVIELLRHLLQS